MKYLKKFENTLGIDRQFRTPDDLSNIVKSGSHNVEKNNIEDLDKFFKNVPDNREKAEVGDTVLGIWFPDEQWKMFIAEELENDLGTTDNDTVYEIQNAYHIIVLK